MIKFIRDFFIIAQLDHGKSDLADRLLVETSTITVREVKDQLIGDLEYQKHR